MKILAIESSCDETAAAVIEDGRKILSSVVDTQIATHALYGGVVPEIASRRHMEAVVRVTEQALKDAAAPGGQDPYVLQQAMRRVIGRWVARRLRRRPMIVPVVTEQ